MKNISVFASQFCLFYKKLMLNMMNTNFIQEAINLSRKKMKNNAGGPFGAIIVKNGKIISYGWNQVTSTNDPTAHAEIMAIRKACKKLNSFQLNDCELYTSCYPCPMCLSAIYWARIKKIYYANTAKDASKIGFDDDFIYKQISLPLEKRDILFKQIGRNDAIKVFREWQKKTDKIMY